MTDFALLVEGEYCGSDVTTSFHGRIYEQNKTYQFFFFKSISSDELVISLDHVGHGEKTYSNLELFFADWKNVSQIV